MMGRIIGIDLGTTNSVCAVMQGGKPAIIPSSEGGRLFPSVVAVNPKTGERMVGQVARRQAVINPDNTIFSIKRLMGRKYSDPEVRKACQFLPYRVESGPNGDAWVVMGNKLYSPPQISAMILEKIKNDAEAYLRKAVTGAVLTVPAYFHDSQRQATKEAGRLAGLDVLRIINESTAASLAYGLDRVAEQTIAIYHLGGGTFDTSMLNVGEGVCEVRSTSGDTFLGGDDFDQRVVNWAADQFQKEHGIDLRTDRQALQRLTEAAEKAKVELSTARQTEINLPYITADASGVFHLQMVLTRARLERLVKDLIARSLDLCKQAMRDARLGQQEIDEVILAGGMTRMPAIQEAVRGLFGSKTYKGVNPDEVAALGAAIQAGVLTGEVKDVLLLDVTPLTLGVETVGGVATPLIERNTTIPIRRSQVFSTADDGQTEVEIHVLQGERPMAADNTSLGKFVLDGIPPAPQGVPQIEVTFDIDGDGTLRVTAVDQATGREREISVVPSAPLPAEAEPYVPPAAGLQPKTGIPPGRTHTESHPSSAGDETRPAPAKRPPEDAAEVSRGKRRQFRDIKLETLNKRLRNLIVDYETANQQLDATLSDVERTRLKRQIKSLESEIEEVEGEIESLSGQ
jgi:molecular chaperone DnaK